MNYKKNTKYFREAKLKFAIFLLVIGFFGLFYKGLGAILIVIGIGIIILQYTGRSTDSEMDAQLNSQLDDIVERGKRECNIDDSQIRNVDPLVRKGYRLDKALKKKGKDGKMRSSLGGGEVFFFADKAIHIFKMEFSLVNSHSSAERDFIPYKEVTGAPSNTDPQQMNGQTVNMETLRILRRDRDPIYITVPQSDEGSLRTLRGAGYFVLEKIQHKQED